MLFLLLFAYFINDSNGYFRTLWEREEGLKTKTFNNYKDKFIKNHKDHAIEITELDVKALSDYSKSCSMKIFNHKTGEWEYFTLDPGFAKYHPLRMLMKFLTSIVLLGTRVDRGAIDSLGYKNTVKILEKLGDMGFVYEFNNCIYFPNYNLLRLFFDRISVSKNLKCCDS